MPSASFVISAAEASARYSRRRETASWMTTPGHRREQQRAEGDDRDDRIRALAAAVERDAEEDVREQRDHADEERHERHQPDVAVADVRHLVGEDALQLPLVQLLDEPGRHRDERVLRATAGGERVRSVVLDEPQLGRLLEAGGDGDVLEEPVEVRVVPLLDLLRAGHPGHHRAGREPRDERVADAADGDDGEDRRIEDEREQDAEPRDEEGEEEEQPDRAPAVRANLLLQRHRLPNATSTGASASSPASKNSRGEKRKSRATIRVGNVCWRVLNRSTVAL